MDNWTHILFEVTDICLQEIMVAVVSWNVKYGFWEKGLKEKHSVYQRGQSAPHISIVVFW